jgi:alkylation response protein AidB-like acyl-CoA dehydrogenase
MAEAGLLGMTAPEKFGGSGADSVALAIAVEEIARADASCSLVLSMANSLSVLTLLRYGTPEQQSHYIPQVASGKTLACFAMSEPHAGSNAAKMRTRTVRKGERYVISGTKQFIVPTETPGYRVMRKEEKLGLRASDTCQIALSQRTDDVSPEAQIGDGNHLFQFQTKRPEITLSEYRASEDSQKILHRACRRYRIGGANIVTFCDAAAGWKRRKRSALSCRS